MHDEINEKYARIKLLKFENRILNIRNCKIKKLIELNDIDLISKENIIISNKIARINYELAKEKEEYNGSKRTDI